MGTDDSNTIHCLSSAIDRVNHAGHCCYHQNSLLLIKDTFLLLLNQTLSVMDQRCVDSVHPAVKLRETGVGQGWGRRNERSTDLTKHVNCRAKQWPPCAGLERRARDVEESVLEVREGVATSPHRAQVVPFTAA
jgi:hypothetical protein